MILLEKEPIPQDRDFKIPGGLFDLETIDGENIELNFKF